MNGAGADAPLVHTRALQIAVPGRILVRTLTARIAAGECWAVLGPNGAGKTLLLRALAGLRAPTGGEVWIDGIALAEWPRRALARRLALLLQEESSADYWGNVAEYVALGRLPHGSTAPGAPEVRTALDRLGIARLSNRSMRTLSGGERQRARIAQTLAQDASVLLWDEPLNHLDLRHQREVMRLAASLRVEGRAIVMTLHDPALAAAHGTHALLLYDSGDIDMGPVASVVTDRAISRLYSLED